MSSQEEKAARFLSLHHGPAPLLIPNPWDLGSAKVLVGMAFEALATTSGGFAATLGRVDGSVRREEAVAHAAAIVAAVDVPVSADFENCFAHEPAGVAATVELGIEAGLAGCSVEDWSGSDIYGIDHAAERVAAAAEVAHGGPVQFVLTGRAENHIHGRQDLADTIDRLQRYQEAGADVLFAPGVIDPDDLRQLIREVDRPVNVVARPGCPPVAELAELGVRRVSVGAWFACAALGALVEAATELRDKGTFGYLDQASIGAQTALRAFNRD
ncbi:MAG: isocitrate lyase/phosphoenolpyruvate mutase family protein [Actinomycetota bacterium]|nr:isocitrate lyase/phosphoenolpyruvate mutase family protein [Actinomycetota bacterium]